MVCGNKLRPQFSPIVLWHRVSFSVEMSFHWHIDKHYCNLTAIACFSYKKRKKIKTIGNQPWPCLWPCVLCEHWRQVDILKCRCLISRGHFLNEAAVPKNFKECPFVLFWGPLPGSEGAELSGAERSGDSEHAVQCCGGASEEVTQVAQRLRRLEGRPEFLRVKGSVN